jgi:hypothetical protein
MNEITFDRQHLDTLKNAVRQIVTETPVTDIHTHLYAPEFGGLLLWGIDELLTYHYLIAEFFRASDMSYDAFWALDKAAQAEAIWEALFLRQSPLSEACRGPLTVLEKLGLDVASRDLTAYRAWYSAQEPAAFVETVFQTARLESAVMTNDPFDDIERRAWYAGYTPAGRFHAALRIDPLLNDWARSHLRLKGWGYDVEAGLGEKTLAETRSFLDDWLERTKALYMAVSLPPEFQWPEDSPRARLIEEAVLPVARGRNLPFAMMIGVTRSVNPALRLAGDGVGLSDVTVVERLCAHFTKNKFMVTMLSRGNQHSLCVASRKFRNLLPFGCWWFLNDPSLIEEMTRMRLELIGPTIIPQHSDARVLDQVIYKWEHSREVIANVLCDKYDDLVRTGWTVSEAEIRRDVKALFGGNFWRFLKATL